MQKKRLIPNNSDSKVYFDRDVDALSILAKNLIDKYKISSDELYSILNEKSFPGDSIPSSILKNRSLGIMECVSKYLKENLNLRYSQIANELNRDGRVIWKTYNNSLKKYKQRLKIEKDNQLIPLSILKDKKLSPLESISVFLRDKRSLSFKEIGLLLNRDNKVIWSSYHKAKTKVAIKKKKR